MEALARNRTPTSPTPKPLLQTVLGAGQGTALFLTDVLGPSTGSYWSRSPSPSGRDAGPVGTLIYCPPCPGAQGPGPPGRCRALLAPHETVQSPTLARETASLLALKSLKTSGSFCFASASPEWLDQKRSCHCSSQAGWRWMRLPGQEPTGCCGEPSQGFQRVARGPCTGRHSATV